MTQEEMLAIALDWIAKPTPIMKTTHTPDMNYYVMDNLSNILFRGTRTQCQTWIETRRNLFRNYGMKPTPMRLFYDTASEPVESYDCEINQ